MNKSSFSSLGRVIISWKSLSMIRFTGGAMTPRQREGGGLNLLLLFQRAQLDGIQMFVTPEVEMEDKSVKAALITAKDLNTRRYG